MLSIRSAARSALLSLALIAGIGTSGVAEAADSPVIHVFFKGQIISFPEAQPVLKNDSTLVPFRKIFETLGFTVKWTESGGLQQAIGTKDGVTITLTINSSTAAVNNQNVALNVPAQIIDGSTMVPLRFVAENSGYEVAYTGDNAAATIQIDEPGAISGNPPPVEEPAKDPYSDKVESYVVKGYVRDTSGNPIAGAEIYADNTLLYDSNILGVTDDKGFYRLELPSIATTWRMGGSYSKTTNGKKYSFDLKPDVDQPFAGNTGAIRDFTWNNAEGYMFIYMDIYSFREGLPEFNYDLTDLEVTLTPVGKRIDGTEGKQIVKRGGQVYDGLGVDQIPLGRYKCTIRWLPEGHDPIPLLVKLENKGKYAESVEFDFPEPKGTTKSNFMVELEASIPPQ
jgi:hypothetical protein